MIKPSHRQRTVKTVLQFAAAVTFAIGLVTLLFPGMVIEIFDGYQADNFHFVRFIGTALIGFSVMNWLYSKFEDVTLVLPVLYGNMTSLVLAVAVDLIGLIIGQLMPIAWLILVLHLVFVVAFGYCIRVIKSV